MPEEAKISVITLNHPEALNAVGAELIPELNKLLDETWADDKNRMVVISMLALLRSGRTRV